MNRRAFLGATARLAALAALGQLGACTQSQPFKFEKDPFTLGVASGDPLPDGVVLWTRLAPQPLSGGGMTSGAVDVEWLVARDEAMKDVVRSGVYAATSDLAHSVHVEVSGLEPDRVYWYRFRAGGAESPVGRTRTTPAVTASQAFRFAFASCQNYTQGYYTAHANLAREDLQAVFFLGDYIYEGTARGDIVRDYSKRGWSFTLADYRDRYAQYKTDSDLQGAHAAFPWIVTWDDHEVENNYAGGINEQDPRNKAALAERAAGYQAFYEHMPVRMPRPQGPDLKLYRSLTYGGHASIPLARGPALQRARPDAIGLLSRERRPDAHDAGHRPASLAAEGSRGFRDAVELRRAVGALRATGLEPRAREARVRRRRQLDGIRRRPSDDPRSVYDDEEPGRPLRR